MNWVEANQAIADAEQTVRAADSMHPRWLKFLLAGEKLRLFQQTLDWAAFSSMGIPPELADTDEQECREAFKAELQQRRGADAPHGDQLATALSFWKAAWNRRAEPDGWRPISEAPRDGTSFIGFAPDDPGGTVGEAFVQLDKFLWMDGHRAKLKKWRPLPDPPEDSL